MTRSKARYVNAQDAVLSRLREMGVDLPEDAVLQRTYAGYVQRGRGAWSWEVVSPSTELEHPMGSQYTMTELLRWPRWQTSLEVGCVWIEPEEEQEGACEGP